MHWSTESAISSARADDFALLPQSLQTMAEIVGMSGVLALVRAFGGVRLYVPSRLPDDHILIELLGRPAAERLAAEYGGQPHFDIPRAEGLLRAVRNRQIQADRAAGLSVRELALKYRLTERAIHDICGPGLVDDGQTDLFGESV
jgi:hypothetical protein